jgi:CRISPR-associated endoribonuclease Cas6
MLASFVVYLQPEQNAFLSLNTGGIIHALFLRLIADSNPDLATQLHSDSPVKPFTVSQLQGKLARTGGHRVALKDNTYWLRFTALTEETFVNLSRVLMAKLARQGKLEIEQTKFRVLDVKLEPTETNPWGGLSSCEQIYENAVAEEKVTLFFYSPTTFRQKGMNLLFPLPVTTFYSYWQRWNILSNVPVDESLIPWVEANVAVEAHRLQTRALPFSDFQSTGFIGTCRYHILENNADYAKQLNALADFAFYCGTGAKTTMGMGQTRRVT